MTAGSRGTKQAREKSAVLSAPSSPVWFLMIGGCGISFPTGIKLFRRVDCQKHSSASWEGEEFEGKGDLFLFLDIRV